MPGFLEVYRSGLLSILYTLVFPLSSSMQVYMLNLSYLQCTSIVMERNGCLARHAGGAARFA